MLGVLLAKFFFVPVPRGCDEQDVGLDLAHELPRLDPQTLALAFVISVGVGILAGFVPAIRSSRLKIVDGLRQVV